MRDSTTFEKKLGSFRLRSGPYGTTSLDGRNGAFNIPLGNKRRAHIICSDGEGWDHVSVHVRIVGSSKKYTPTWEDMCKVKELFFDESECVIQYHPQKSDYVNLHPNVLHLWKPQGIDLPKPPTEFV